MALRVALMSVDAVSAVLVFLLASFVRFGTDGRLADLWLQSGIGIDIRLAAATFAVLWVGALWYLGLYALRARWRLLSEAKDIAKASLLVLALTLSTLFVLKLEDVSRLFLALLFISQPIVTLAGRAVLRWWFAAVRRQGYDTRYMVVAGTGTLAQGFADRVESHPGLGMRVIGHLSIPGEVRLVTRPILGGVDEIERIFHSRIVDEVAVCLPPTAAHYLEPIAGLAAGEGKTVRIPLDPVEDLLPNAHREEFDGLLIRSLVHDGHREVGLIVKRIIDIVGSHRGARRAQPAARGHRAADLRARGLARSCSGRPASACTVARSPSTSSARWCSTPRIGWTRSATSTSGSASPSRRAATLASRRWADGCARPRSTSSRSCGTS